MSSQETATSSSTVEDKKMRVCVIGAGACGIVSTKECMDAGFSVTCYEKSDSIGGLWRFRSSGSEIGSVGRSTVTNSSKELSAFSDFPPADHYPNFMPHTLVVSEVFLLSHLPHPVL